MKDAIEYTLPRGWAVLKIPGKYPTTCPCTLNGRNVKVKRGSHLHVWNLEGDDLNAAHPFTPSDITLMAYRPVNSQEWTILNPEVNELLPTIDAELGS